MKEWEVKNKKIVSHLSHLSHINDKKNITGK
jgi:hypothetical protein